VRYVPVARMDELPADRAVALTVAGLSLVLVRSDGQCYALQGRCPHQDLTLAGARVWQGVLDCPWHHFTYDVRTGENLYPRHTYPLCAQPQLGRQVVPLCTYPVRLVAGAIEVGLPDIPPVADSGCDREAPAS
jgi:nitrite reductase/ring-hydroxylating ferredoxin subunit